MSNSIPKRILSDIDKLIREVKHVKVQAQENRDTDLIDNLTLVRHHLEDARMRMIKVINKSR